MHSAVEQSGVEQVIYKSNNISDDGNDFLPEQSRSLGAIHLIWSCWLMKVAGKRVLGMGTLQVMKGIGESAETAALKLPRLSPSADPCAASHIHEGLVHEHTHTHAQLCSLSSPLLALVLKLFSLSLSCVHALILVIGDYCPRWLLLSALLLLLLLLLISVVIRQYAVIEFAISLLLINNFFCSNRIDWRDCLSQSFKLVMRKARSVDYVAKEIG